VAHLGLYTTQDLLHVYSVPRDLVLVLASSDLNVGRSWKPNISSCTNLKLSLSVINIQVNLDELRDDSITRLQIWKGLKVHQKNKTRGESWAIKQRKNWALSTQVWKVMGLQSYKLIHMCLRSFLRKDHCSNPDKIVSVWVYRQVINHRGCTKFESTLKPSGKGTCVPPPNGKKCMWGNWWEADNKFSTGGKKHNDLENMLNLKKIGSAETTNIQIAGMRVVIRCYLTPVWEAQLHGSCSQAIIPLMCQLQTVVAELSFLGPKTPPTAAQRKQPFHQMNDFSSKLGPG
jgi:hypothetical protein